MTRRTAADMTEAMDDDDDMEIATGAFDRQYGNDFSWEQLQEDEQGRLRPIDPTAEQRAKRRRLLSESQSCGIRKGMIRYVQLVIDLSRGASAPDMRPSRMSAMLAICKSFIREFFDQNSLSQLGILVMRDGVAERLTDLSGTPEAQVARLASCTEAGGDASLQNALELGLSTLRSVPPYGHREILIMYASLSTCDPGNVMDTIKQCKDSNVRVSIVNVAAEMYICKRACEETGGLYGVALNQAHLEELMMAHAPPPPAAGTQTGAELVRMGFPQRGSEDPTSGVYVGRECVLRPGCYTCPRCKALTAELPCACHTCGLQLVSSPHLARSYHHLFPVRPFVEVTREELQQAQAAAGADNGSLFGSSGLCCFGCLNDLSSRASTAAKGVVLRCPQCKMLFCFQCDSYIHESLHNCPGCEVYGSTTALESMEQ